MQVGAEDIKEEEEEEPEKERKRKTFACLLACFANDANDKAGVLPW